MPMLLDADFRLINEEFYAQSMSPHRLDSLLADGWRHFGTQFFRYNLAIYQGGIRRVIPLRIRLADICLSKSQRRILRRNDDLATEIHPIEITDETHDLFNRHKERFKGGIPDSIYDFLSLAPSNIPTKGLEVSVRDGDKLVAASFFDAGEASISSIYGCFDPEETFRSLGIFTMLKEIEYARENAKTFYYHGYAYDGASFYDYKKRFSALEQFDWDGNWISMQK